MGLQTAKDKPNRKIGTITGLIRKLKRIKREKRDQITSHKWYSHLH